MVITFPHFGNTFVAAKALFEGLGINYVVPQHSSNKTLEAGNILSPDEICIPFKIMMGNLIDGLDHGADTVLMPSSCGPCRFGEYCQLQIEILRNKGYKLELIAFDKYSAIGRQEFMHRINKITSQAQTGKIIGMKALTDAYYILNATDKLEQKCRFLCGYEKNYGSFKRILIQFKSAIDELNNPKDLIRCIKKYQNYVDEIPLVKDRNPIKISLIGEIYTINEAFSNYSIEDKLMDYQISLKRLLSPSWWVKDVILSPLGINSLRTNIAAKNYLNLGIGGYAKESIGEAMLAAHMGFDGVVQIFPLGCMPEIVSKAILKQISVEESLPVLNLVVDGLNGEAGIVTRLEAFLDTLERRRECIL